MLCQVSDTGPLRVTISFSCYTNESLFLTRVGIGSAESNLPNFRIHLFDVNINIYLRCSLEVHLFSKKMINNMFGLRYKRSLGSGSNLVLVGALHLLVLHFDNLFDACTNINKCLWHCGIRVQTLDNTWAKRFSHDEENRCAAKLGCNFRVEVPRYCTYFTQSRSSVDEGKE